MVRTPSSQYRGPRFNPWMENPTNCKVRPKTKHGTWDWPGGPVFKTPRFYAGGLGLIPGWETKIPHTLQCDRKKTQKATTTLKSSIALPFCKSLYICSASIEDSWALHLVCHSALLWLGYVKKIWPHTDMWWEIGVF